MEKIFVSVLAAGLVLYAALWLYKIAALGRRCKQTPKPGERWAFMNKQGPWPNKDYAPVVILDVRDGWVRYDMSVLKDQRMELDFFVRLYRPVDA